MIHTAVDDLWHWVRPYKPSQQAANHGICASLSADSWPANTSQLATLLHYQGGTVAVTMILSTCWVVEMPNVAQCCSIWDHGDWVHVNTESRENYNFFENCKLWIFHERRYSGTLQPKCLLNLFKNILQLTTHKITNQWTCYVMNLRPQDIWLIPTTLATVEIRCLALPQFCWFIRNTRYKYNDLLVDSKTKDHENIFGITRAPPNMTISQPGAWSL